MKFLENTKLAKLTHELTDVVCGTRVINGRIETYICKRTGVDKKYAYTLSQRYTNEVGEMQKGNRSGSSNNNTSPLDGNSTILSHDGSPYYTNSPLGDFHETRVQRLMTDLILTLNATFVDYDFGSIRPDHFRKIPSVKVALSRVNERLSEVAQQRKQAGFLNELWKSIDEAIKLTDCQVYSFEPDEEGDDNADPFVTHTPPVSFDHYLNDDMADRHHNLVHEAGPLLWSFNYFFVNKHLKRILFFTCVQSCLKEDSSFFDDDEGVDIHDMLKSSVRTIRDDSVNGSFDVEDEEGYDGFAMDVDVVDGPAVSFYQA